MKWQVFIIAIIIFSGCNKTSQNNQTPNADNIGKENKSYNLITRSAISQLEYNPNLKEALNIQKNPDLYFSKEILRLLDKSLIDKEFTININNETIISPQGDTIAFTVYDFLNNKKDSLAERIFDKSPFIEKPINIFPAPLRGLYFMNGNNLCVVIRKGIESDSILNNESFKRYIKTETENRLSKKE